MIIHLYDVDDCPHLQSPSVVGIGVFDGLHLGHQKIINNINLKAKESGFLPVVLTFDPHPDAFFSKKQIPLIQTLDQRVQSLLEAGLKRVIVVRFNQKFASLSAEDFLSQVLLGCLKAKIIITGENFRFGHQRQGTPETLKKWGPQMGFTPLTIPSLKVNGQIVSSSYIRELLYSGKIEKANQLLGRPYSIEGVVIPGQARGNQLGFPTANLETSNHLLLSGVFITVVEWQDQKWPALTNVGRCPTFNQNKTQVECHLLNFNGELYGEKMKIHFYHKLRDEKQFPTAKDLAEQIKKDRQEAEDYFNHHQLGDKE